MAISVHITGQWRIRISLGSHADSYFKKLRLLSKFKTVQYGEFHTKGGRKRGDLCKPLACTYVNLKCLEPTVKGSIDELLAIGWCQIILTLLEVSNLPP
jgi:hypothetical protein